MDLPEGFRWDRRWQYDRGENAVYLDGVYVAYLDTTADGLTWLAWLDCQRRYEEQPQPRRCTSREAGARGCAMWVCRHEERLRREVAAVIERRRLNRHPAAR